MARKTGNIQPQLDLSEHEDSLPPPTKQVLIYGFDGTNKQIVKLNSDGEIITSTTGGEQALQLDDTSTSNVTYVGLAPTGTATSTAGWQIKKIDETSGIVITWADSNDNYDNIYDNRTSLTYG